MNRENLIHSIYLVASYGLILCATFGLIYDSEILGIFTSIFLMFLIFFPIFSIQNSKFAKSRRNGK